MLRSYAIASRLSKTARAHGAMAILDIAGRFGGDDIIRPTSAEIADIMELFIVLPILQPP